MDIERIDNSALDEGAWLPVELPEALAESGPVRIKLRSTESDLAKKPMAEHQRRVAKARAADGPQLGSELADSEAQLYAALTVAWEGVLANGEPWPATIENARRLYRSQAWLLKQVRIFVFSDDPFLAVRSSS